MRTAKWHILQYLDVLFISPVCRTRRTGGVLGLFSVSDAKPLIIFHKNK